MSFPRNGLVACGLFHGSPSAGPSRGCERLTRGFPTPSKSPAFLATFPCFHVITVPALTFAPRSINAASAPLNQNLSCSIFILKVSPPQRVVSRCDRTVLEDARLVRFRGRRVSVKVFPAPMGGLFGGAPLVFFCPGLRPAVSGSLEGEAVCDAMAERRGPQQGRGVPCSPPTALGSDADLVQGVPGSARCHSPSLVASRSCFQTAPQPTSRPQGPGLPLHPEGS